MNKNTVRMPKGMKQTKGKEMSDVGKGQLSRGKSARVMPLGLKKRKKSEYKKSWY